MSRQASIPELVVPAGTLECVRCASTYGADAIYLGVGGFNMRAKARNLDWDEYAEALDLAEERGVKIYVTANVLVGAGELPAFRAHLERLLARPPHAVILSDPGALRLLRAIRPEQRVHLSTQASVSNPEAAAFWHEAGVTRINLAREVAGADLSRFRDACPDVEVEVFVHGSMCIAYSGHCLLSSALARRSANRGGCAQPCRWDWSLVEARRPDEALPVVEEEGFTSILSSRDLCLAREIPAMAAAGVDALKVEGRMKGPAYVSAVTRTYRAILDALASEGADFVYRDAWDRVFAETTHRPFGRGFWDGRPGDGTSHEKGYRSGSRFLGRVESLGDDPRHALVVARAELRRGQELVLRHPTEGDLRCRIVALESAAGRPRERVRSGDLVRLVLDHAMVEDAVLVEPRQSSSPAVTG